MEPSGGILVNKKENYTKPIDMNYGHTFQGHVMKLFSGYAPVLEFDVGLLNRIWLIGLFLDKYSIVDFFLTGVLFASVKNICVIAVKS